MTKKQPILKVYISGQISGLTHKEVNKKFEEAAELLEAIGCEPINPLKNGLPDDAGWDAHMLEDIKMLFNCDAILMLKCWTKSKGATIEHCIAQQKKMPILFEDVIVRSNEVLRSVKMAVEEVTGLTFQDYIINSRKQSLFFARVIFAHQCHKFGMKLVDIGSHMNRDHSSVSYYIKKYSEERKYNKQFDMMAQQVNDIVTKAE